MEHHIVSGIDLFIRSSWSLMWGGALASCGLVSCPYFTANGQRRSERTWTNCLSYDIEQLLLTISVWLMKIRSAFKNPTKLVVRVNVLHATSSKFYVIYDKTSNLWFYQTFKSFIYIKHKDASIPTMLIYPEGSFKNWVIGEVAILKD